jgi:hypothetical protein
MAMTPGCQQLQDNINTAHDEHVASTAAWITGGVLAAAAIGTWFLWPKPAQTARALVVPTASRDGAGAAIVGAF